MTRDELIAENRKLRNALEGLICWAEPPAGPSWATPEAKKANLDQFEKALQAACDCFPEDYDGFAEHLSSN